MRLQLHNVDVRLIDRGSGPPILFLHGNPDTAPARVADDLALFFE